MYNLLKSNFSVSRCRKVFVFVQEAIAIIAEAQPETSIKLYLESALMVDKFASKGDKVASGQNAFGAIAYGFVSQAFSLYEENSGDSRLQNRCVTVMIGTLLACRSLSKEDYESLIMKVAQYSAKLLRKPEQCLMVAQCSHLFFVVGSDGVVVYDNAQRSLECLQRALKLADSCTTSNPSNVQLFVDLLEHYLFFFQNGHPSISGNYINGLVALIKQHTDSLGQSVATSKAHFLQIVAHIRAMKDKEETAEKFSTVDVSSA